MSNFIPYVQIESNKETGNWAYVVRDCENRIILATGCRSLAFEVLDDISNVDDEKETKT